ncbi:MAG: DUF899 family protein [Pseudomonadales bacterium]|nr:DUF899 family protein [Pseudomonadales bacterium]
MSELADAEKALFELTQKVSQLRAKTPLTPVRNYEFTDLQGTVSLLDLFGDKTILFVIHNMGDACRYCTLWADGLNGFVPHLESRYALVLVSKNDPQHQRDFANARGWRFRMASHGGGDYIREQTVMSDYDNMPGVVCYVREGEQIFRKNAQPFGPGDQFCAIWPMLSLAGEGEAEWHPQFSYWHRPAVLEDGGANPDD